MSPRTNPPRTPKAKPKHWVHLHGPAGELVLEAFDWLMAETVSYIARQPPRPGCGYTSPVNGGNARQFAADLRLLLAQMPDEEEEGNCDAWYYFAGAKKDCLRQLLAFVEAGPFEFFHESDE